MNEFTVEKIDPPIQTPLSQGGGFSVWDTRNYELKVSPASKSQRLSLKQTVGFINPRGEYIDQRTEKNISLTSDAFALLDQTAYAAAPDNASRVVLIQKAFDDNKAAIAAAAAAAKKAAEEAAATKAAEPIAPANG